jgi:hypothetical protein
MKRIGYFRYPAVLMICALSAGCASSSRGLPGIAYDPGASKLLGFQVSYKYWTGDQGSFKPFTDGAVLHSGDYYTIHFTPREDSYVYIFQIDSNQGVYQLFPMESFKGVALDNRNPVRAGMTYVLPAQDKSFQLDDRTGRETIYFMASRQPDQTLEEQYEALSQARQEQRDSLIKQLQEQLTTSIKTRGLGTVVSNQAQGARRAEQVSVVTFEHR